MKKNLKLMIFLLGLVLLCVGTLPLALAEDERPGLPTAGLPTAGLPTSSHANLTTSLSAPAVVLQGTRTYQQDVAKVLKRHDSLELEPQRVAEQVRLTGRLLIPTSGATFDLRLAPHDMRGANYRAEATFDGGEVRLLEPGPVRTYKGTVEGMEGAQARFTIDDNTVEGLIITPSQLYFVEPASRYSALASRKDFVVYKESDLLQRSFGDCGNTLAEKVTAEAARVQSQVPTSSGKGVGTEELFSPPRIIDLATEADFEYFTQFGSEVAANNEILSIMNDVEGIYNTQFGLQFTIVFQNVWATAADPYTTTASNAALSEFANEWNITRQAVARDLAHMWTGKNFDGTVIGIAFQPGMECPFAQSGYGMSQRLSGSPDKFLLTAHEIGHNFNASHTDTQPGCEDSIMGTTLSSTTTPSFCPFSVNQIEAHANLEVACLSQALTPGCTYTLSHLSQTFAVDGGAGTVNVTTTGTSCVWVAGSTVNWITITSGASGTNSGSVNFTVNPNTVGFARSGIIRIAEQNFTVSQSAGSGCVVTPISVGQTINGALSTGDCRSSQRDFAFADQYSFSGAAGDQIRIEMSSTATPTLDTYLYLIGPTGAVLTENDDILFPNTDSRIPINGFFTLPAAGAYVIEATSFATNETGTYTLVLTSSTPTPTPTPTPVFNISGRVSEGSISGPGVSGVRINISVPPNVPAQVPVITNSNGDFQFTGLPGGGPYNLSPEDTRFFFSPGFQLIQNLSGNVTNTNFVAIRRTIDLSGRVVEGSTGLAGVTVWLLHQATQQTRSTVTGADGRYQFAGAFLNEIYEVIPFKDGYRFNPPSLILPASQPDLGDITATLGNPIDGSQFFVTKHYEDFFGRQPDAPGLAFWVNGINGCDPFALCRQVKRIDTSAAFFLSIEFQETGYLVYRLYKAAYGDLAGAQFPVRRAEFIPDTRTIGSGVVVGQAGWELVLENNKQSFVGNFVTLTPFTNAHPTTTTPAQFVDTLFARAGFTPSALDRQAAIDEFGTAGDIADPAARARALRRVAEHSLLRAQEFNKAFVLMQYFGYLQRNPDDAPDNNLAGYNFWLAKLNQFNGDFRQAEMVKAFIVSSEYRSRFGPP